MRSVRFRPARSDARAGLTLLEVIVALAIVAILTALLTTAVTGNLQKTRTFGARSESAQILNYIGRRVAGGDNDLLAEAGTPLTWDYGELVSAFPDLSAEGGYAEPDRFRATVTNRGSVQMPGTSADTAATRYEVEICTRAAGGESCLVGTTFGAAPSVAGTVPPLPGLN
jgi:prepilin-type N-terminal cleavage/methylation domain-containing protein